MHHSPILVALDGISSPGRARTLVQTLSGHAAGFKVGASLLAHPHLAADVRSATKSELMIDLKFHDIPRTMAEAAAAFGYADYITVHASAPREAIAAAAAAAPQAQIAGVTVLTSMSDAACREVFGSGTDTVVPKLALRAVANGARAIVCSGRELRLLRHLPDFSDTTFLVPGIRPENAPPDDQTRTMTPREAVEAGAHRIIVGRAILNADDPVTALLAISESLARG